MCAVPGLLLLLLSRSPDPPPEITWPEFFAQVSTQGLVYSDRLKSLEGRRVRLRGFAITRPAVPGGILLSRDPYSDPHDVDETDVPYDVVGVGWRVGLAIPRIPGRPTVEGTLLLGNREMGEQVVSIFLDNAIPVPSPVEERPRKPSRVTAGGGPSSRARPPGPP